MENFQAQLQNIQVQVMQYINVIQTELQQYANVTQQFIMTNWKQYSEIGTQYFEQLVPGHGYEIVVALTVVVLTTLLILLTAIPCCLCGCCGGRRRNRKSRSPVVLMVGIPGSGKTAAVARLVYGEMCNTHMSQTENVVSDVELGEGVRATVVDTPGHQRVRSVWHNYVGRNAGSQAATHILFMINSVDVRKDVKEVAQFLYDILSDSEVQDEEIPVMLLCTKSDMETACPERTIRPLIERQLQQLREAAQIDAHEKPDIVSNGVDEKIAFNFDNATCPCVFATASARTGNFDAIARFVREM